MKLLIVGGTLFLGPRLVEAALARGHHVATFTRGRHADTIYPHVERLTGDRNGDVSALQGTTWDAVIDTCGYVPGSVQRILDALESDRLSHYTFVSSVSVYADLPPAGSDETQPVATITPAQLREAEDMATGARANARTYGDMYGALKALCEEAAEQRMPGRVLNVRPGLIVGSHDYSDRFTYWVRRVARGGNVLAPAPSGRRVRVIDARDLADWIIRMAEDRVTGVFNATGAENGLTFGTMLDVCRGATASDAQFLWIDGGYLLEKGAQPWSDMPLWLPAEYNGIFEARNDKAIEKGLTFRSLADTVTDTYQWDATRPQDKPMKAGLSSERERELLSDAPHSSH